MEYNYITLGYDCSTAAVLRDLDLRKYSLPFDWVVTKTGKLCECIMNDFEGYHSQLKFNSNKSRLIDMYGFEFPHDYPTTEVGHTDNIGDGTYGESVIIDNWVDYHQIALDKYDRRIKRFNDILRSDEPIIVLYRGDVNNINLFKKTFKEKYNKENIKYVVAFNQYIQTDDIISCDPEKNGGWNDKSIWLDSINKIKQ